MFSIFGLLIFLLPFCLPNATAAEPYALLGLLYLVVLLVFSAFWGISRGLPVKKFRSVGYPLALTLFFLGVAVAGSAGQLKSSEEISKYFIGFLLFAIGASLSLEEKNRLTYDLVLAAFCISLIAVFQYFFGFQLLLNYLKNANIHDPFVLEKIAQQRVFFPFPSPTILGGYLAMILPLALTLKRGKLFAVPLVLALLLSRSLGALLSLAFVLTALSFLKNQSRKKKVLVPLFLGAVVGCIFLVRIHNPQFHLLPAFSIEERLNYWNGAWRIIRAHPWIGTGLGSFDLPGYSFYAHNIFLQFWAEAGIASVLCFFWLVFAILKNGWKNLQGSSTEKHRWGLFAGVCVFLIHNLVDCTFFLPVTGFTWWVMMGLLFSPDSEKEI